MLAFNVATWCGGGKLSFGVEEHGLESNYGQMLVTTCTNKIYQDCDKRVTTNTKWVLKGTLILSNIRIHGNHLQLQLN